MTYPSTGAEHTQDDRGCQKGSPHICSAPVLEEVKNKNKEKKSTYQQTNQPTHNQCGDRRIQGQLKELPMANAGTIQSIK